MGANTEEEHSEPLLDSARNNSSDVEERSVIEKNYASTRFYEKKIFLFASMFWFAGSLLLFASAILLHSRPRPRGIEAIYSPVQDHIRYKTVVFDPSNGIGNIYMEPPSPDLDRTWSDLYDFGLSWITPTEASHLPNATSRLPSHPTHYVTGLDVFHQLRCLDLIRKRLNPSYYVNDTHVRVEHCVDQLRQSLMCSSDTATMPWAWSREREMTLPSARTTHMCTDFEGVRRWARAREVVGGFDKGVFMEGSAVGVP